MRCKGNQFLFTREKPGQIFSDGGRQGGYTGISFTGQLANCLSDRIIRKYQKKTDIQQKIFRKPGLSSIEIAVRNNFFVHL